MSLGLFTRKKPRKADVFRNKRERNIMGPRDRRTHRIVLAASFLVLVVTLIDPEPLTSSIDTPEQSIIVNQIANQDWRAEFAFEAPDVAATAQARNEAAAKVNDIYTIKREAYQEQLRKLDQRFEALRAHREPVAEHIREALLESDSSQDARAVVEEAVRDYAQSVKSQEAFSDVEESATIAAWLMPTMGSVPERVFAEPAGNDDDGSSRRTLALEEPEGADFVFEHGATIARIARRSLELVLNHGVLGLDPDIAVDPEKKIRIVRHRTLNELPASEDVTFADVPAPDKARDALRVRVREMVRQAEQAAPEGAVVDWARLEAAAYDLTNIFVAPTLHYNALDTANARRAARAAVEPVMKTVERGEIIQRDGEPWTEQTVSDISVYLEKRRTGTEPAVSLLVTLVSHMILAALVLIAFVKTLPVLLHRDQEYLKALKVCMLIVCGMLVLGRIASYFDPTGYIVPAAAATILLTILTNARVAALAGGVVALLLSIQYGYGWGLMVVSAVMATAGAMSITKVRRRGDMARAAVIATIAGVFAVAAVTLGQESLDWDAFSRSIVLILLNGAACMFIVPGLLPPLERLLGIITDIQLLEYSDLNNEILSRLAIEVPATYSHSLQLGQLAEAACEAIGANGLLARVSAYYHDIGKIRRPEYFSENQTGHNIHDGLSPRLSARAISSHVLEGAEMARELHLPKPIIDGILEHHGTNLISFFYQQALEQSKHDDVREEDFRYPGPKPQSRETAILMVCDAVESGVRSIKNPNEDRVREFVDRIVRSRAEDRQFDECDLTLRDLDVISRVVSRRVLSSLHTRIAYPPKATEERRTADNVIPLSGGGE